MSIFVTQAVDSLVTVLVFARPSPITEALQAALKKKQLDVLFVDPFVVSEKGLQKYQQPYYKICWIFDDTIKGTSQADLIFRFLFSREEPLIILTAIVSKNSSNPEWEKKREGDERLLQHFKEFLPFCQTFVVVNLIDQPDLFVSPATFLTTSRERSEFKEGVVVADVVPKLIQALLRPHRAHLEKIEGKHPFQTSDLELPKPRPLDSEFEERLDHTSHIQVIPLSNPKIPNRQKLYEENISKIKHRYTKQKLLRPISYPMRLPTSGGETLKPFEQHLEMTIQHLFGSQRTEQRESRFQKKALKTVKTRQRQGRQKWVMKGLVVLVVLLVVFLGSLASFFGLRSLLFRMIMTQSSGQNLSDQPTWQSPWTKILLNVLATETQIYQMVTGQDSLSETVVVVSAARQMQTIHQQRQQLGELMEKAVSQVMGKTPGNALETVSELELQQQTLYSTLSVIQTQLQSIPTEFLTEQQNNVIEKILDEIQQTRRQVATFEQVHQLLPSFLAAEERRRIAVVVQDSQELRPSGGIVVGVYLVTLEKGAIIDQQFYDETQIEALNTGIIQAPADYQKYLNTTNMTFLNAGWTPDFTETSTIVNNYLDRNLGRKADFIVGINTLTLQQLLEKTGPVQIEKTGEQITAKNLFERLEAHPEAEYLKSVFATTLKNIFTQPPQMVQALSVFANELQDGRVFLVSAQPTENDVLNSLGWAGQVSIPQCPGQLAVEKCQVSTIYQVESNIGLNKIGQFITRQVEHDIRVGKTATLHQRMVIFTNKATTTRWPSGAYRNYLRFYLPTDSVVKGIRIDGKPLDLQTIDREMVKTGQVIGFTVDIPIQSTVKVLLEYQQPFVYSPGVSFAFFDQRQAATQVENYTLTVTSEDGLQPTVIAPKAVVQGNKIVFQQAGDKHQFIGIKFR